MPRSVRSGVISFSMVSIPVKLCRAAVSKDVPFHLLHRKCGKERPCVLRASNNMIVLEILSYPDEVRVDPSLKSSRVRLPERELSMASTLVELLTKTFAPNTHKDGYREALMELINTKVKGKEVSEIQPAAVPN